MPKATKTDRQHIVLDRSWGGYREGQRLAVLGPRDPIEGACVDASKATTLVERGFASRPPAAHPPAEADEPELEAEAQDHTATPMRRGRRKKR